jgi:hypothetical protein
MRTGIWAYPWDLADEGIGTALGRIRGRAGAEALSVAAVYHAGKFLHVHNPVRRVVFPRSGTLYFEPGDWHGRLRIVPPVWEGAPGFWPQPSWAFASRGSAPTGVRGSRSCPLKDGAVRIAHD